MFVHDETIIYCAHFQVSHVHALAVGTEKSLLTCTQGYYKQEDKTKKVLVNGWLHSGDIGTWTPEGRLQLIDR